MASLAHETRLLLTAVQYFTRVPVPRWVGHGTSQLSGTTRYLPAVGLAVGAIAAACFWASAMVFPAVIAAILSTAATLIVTGAFHEDGLADTLDGLGGGHTRERALEIMKDPRVGTFGVLSLVGVVGLKVAALSALPTAQVVVALIAGHALSRWCAVLVAWRLPYARVDGSARAKPVSERISLTDLTIASVLGLAPPGLCGMHALFGLAAALLTAGCVGVWFARRLGGHTGDTLGATQQLTEVAFYLALLAAWNSY
jgi:adenosylcobinamide-GDP ribazoletransferase